MSLEVTKEDYDRFWKWMMVPMMDVPDDELIWCSEQDMQNSWLSKRNWMCEIERRGLDPLQKKKGKK